MSQNNRRQFLKEMACAAASLALLPIWAESERKWLTRDVDWDVIINDVIGNTNAVLAGVSRGRPIYDVGSPHWCMERALSREFQKGRI